MNTVPTGNVPRANRAGNEEQPLLGQPAASKKGWRKKMMVNVHRDWADVVLVLCYIITGLLDSASISTWGSFVSMQTGNTVYIGLGLAAPHESKRSIKSGISLISFCVGSFCFSRFHRYFTASRRWVLCASFLIQMSLIVTAAAILTWGPKSGSDKDSIGWNVLIPIALVAFQSCGQAVTSRALKYNALTSVVLTSIYCDLFSDAELFVLHNAERNRRVGAPVLLLFGAVMGGLLAHSTVGTAGVLWIAAALKLLVVVSWFFWPAANE
ncbi:uncharacterized protein BCR38DRAFT_339037 [Pseudomassariella vexata]|uniref:DUF1275 domain protein n=1 Tax=Pseudomassariella vexata TaxID=1141098 RepID=A0A1Y2E2M8_9PEZI|nr:uncharacterized protein BCR38DRAFT_339037 [Pseudomassariella vexata]ORY65759.1 hypothetical protein BCR38DRAFT_339037 [Pseudomassariella vexata]